MTYGCEPVLPNQPVVNTLRVSLSEPEIEELQRRRLNHVQDLNHLRTEANAKALRRLENEAERRDETYGERALAIGDEVKRPLGNRPTKLHPCWDGLFSIHDQTDRNTYQPHTRNGYILRSLVDGERHSRFESNEPETAIWCGSA